MCARRGRLLTRAGDRGARRGGRRPRDRARRPPARSSSLLEQATPPPAPGSQGPIGHQPDALPWMPGGASQPLRPRTPSAALGYGGTARRSRAGCGRSRPRRARSACRRSRPARTTAPRIAQYRAASGAEATPGPLVRLLRLVGRAQAGAPLGDAGQGFGAVSQIQDWAARTGRLVPAGRAAAAGRHHPLRRRARRHRRVRGPGRPADDGRGQPLATASSGSSGASARRPASSASELDSKKPSSEGCCRPIMDAP